jgi:carboxypeptidase Taq
VRITTHYYEDAPTFSIYSTIHEGGHAIYELGCDDIYNYTFLSGGVSMGIHESQSRFFENIIGRSLPFVRHIFPRMQSLFPEQLGDVTAEQFYRAVNKAQPSLIRTEADELSYCLHVMVRYEMEKQLIAGTLAVTDVPKEWNRLYREYLGVEVPDDKNGCLQDSHWSGGSFGYFPSYALGSAYGAQMLHTMENDLGNIDEEISKNGVSNIKAWLGNRIHQHASLYKPGELLENVCGKFDAQYYIDYLTKKFTELYQL